MRLLGRSRHIHVALEAGEEAQLVQRDLPKQCFSFLKRIRLKQ